MPFPQYHPSNNILIDRSKCVFCGTCAERCILDHIRLQLSPCRQACPIGQNCQAYVQQILRGQSDRALATILETNPLPGILGRICHHPCERACARRKIDDSPVSIRTLKRFLSETVARPDPPNIPYTHRGEVGIVGAGPAGLTAAWELRRRGHPVRVYDKALTPGGKLTHAVPEFRLPLKTAMADIDWIQRWGVEFRLGFDVGRDMPFDIFRSRHSAVLLATGGGRPGRLDIEGEKSSNVLSALQFLEAAKAGQIPRMGDSVIVFGGGNVAVDTALTVKKLGVASVRIISLERPENLPAFSHHVQEALAEGITLEYGWGPHLFATRGDLATAVKCRLCLCVWQNQCFAPIFDCSIERDFSADFFLVAIGDEPDRGFLQSIGWMTATEPVPTADPMTSETKLKGVFAAGDMVSKAGHVVDAMALGQQAAVSIDRYIKGDDLRYGRAYAGPYITEFEIPCENRQAQPKQISLRPAPGDGNEIQEPELTFDGTRALEESRRCLNCGVPVGSNDSCWACLPCEVSCPEQALRVNPPFLIK